MIDEHLWKLPGIKRRLIYSTIYALLKGLAIVGQAAFLTQALTAAWRLQINSAWYFATLFFFIFFCLRQFFDWLQTRQLSSFAAKTAYYLKQQIDAKILLQGPAIVDHLGSGNLLTLSYERVDQIRIYLETILARFTDLMTIPWLILIYVFWQNWQSGLILFCSLPLIVFFMIILGLAAQKKADAQYADFAALNNHFLDAVRGLETLKMLAVSQKYSQSVKTASEDYRKKTMSVLQVAFTSSFALDFFTTLSIAIEAVMLGIALINRQLPLAPALAVLIVSPDFFLPLRQFGEDYHANLDGKNALHELSALLEMQAPKRIVMRPADWSQESQLSLSHLSYRYAENADAVQDLNLTIHGFSKIAIVGMSGAGKSTLLNLLAGFLQPDQPNPAFNLDGQSLMSLNADSWQKQLSYMPQNPYLFSASIEKNIAFYDPQASRQRILAAADQAGLSPFLENLPNGLDTQVGESHRGISGGQAQRIVLARALLDPKRRIWLMDEPSAHLDIESEYALKQTILPLTDHRLLILATHRLHWLKQMDWIVVMKAGRIVQQGRLDDLINQPGELKNMSDSLATEGDLHAAADI
ncbi:Transport ATP-binding protein CydD [Oenococcus kitaharae DSM 17330]|uniref:Transport ATP-binding protein CydD n=2 Tax=Oenococcus kitaharae TaxID=336988 RepID=G9WFV7_9LACO|nr:Transport ATP-binding protein CydD [Oenococcus kitaharae DSM 17330]OEY83342.1 hypothetical protein NT95_04185 [Oenococcus kitaharae]OEY85140.1 hypothetical protein NT96_00625 [Oenococcus kitaharae]OEY85995.1 hypothetical protein NV75_00575 [Oenococcus kitaharae]